MHGSLSCFTQCRSQRIWPRSFSGLSYSFNFELTDARFVLQSNSSIAPGGTLSVWQVAVNYWTSIVYRLWTTPATRSIPVHLLQISKFFNHGKTYIFFQKAVSLCLVTASSESFRPFYTWCRVFDVFERGTVCHRFVSHSCDCLL